MKYLKTYEQYKSIRTLENIDTDYVEPKNTDIQDADFIDRDTEDADDQEVSKDSESESSEKTA